MASMTSETGSEAQRGQTGDPGSMIEDVRGQVSQLGSQVRDFVQHGAKDMADRTTEAAESYVRQQPLTAVAIAAGTGLLLGLMLMRGRGNRYSRSYHRQGGPKLSRRDFDRLRSTIEEGFESLRPRGEPMTDRITNALSSWLDTYGARASEAASAGTRAAKRMANHIGARL
jgi:ElaB/YqjD/DUF883 family membrane-anchored ribosome-binding protein